MKQIFAARFRNILAGGILFGFLAGCSVLDPAEDIPSYIRINAISLNATGSQGSSTAQITDAWVFMDGALLGAYELPCTLPILDEGAHSFIIRAGIKMNGLSSTRAIYPYMKGWEGVVTLTRAQVTTIEPVVVTYFPGTTFLWQEDFDQPGLSLVTDPSTPVTIRRDTVTPFEGYASGYVKLNADTPLFLCASSSFFDIAPPSSDVYIEFDYRSNNEFTVGILGQSNDYHSWLLVSPSENWNKIYIRLTDVLGSVPTSSDYKIYLALSKQSTVAEPYLYLDNIKLLK